MEQRFGHQYRRLYEEFIDESPLILSTIHSAKGLEFHTVFVIQVLEGVLPSGYSLKDDDALDEELRLLYVAITRAEENLFITYPSVQYRRFEGEYFARPSRFISDVPESILEPCVLVEESGRQLTVGDGGGASALADGLPY